MSELKNCPFCGGEAFHDIMYFKVFCMNCEIGSAGEGRQDYVKAWNTRQDIPRAKIEELVMICESTPIKLRSERVIIAKLKKLLQDEE